MLKRYQSDVSGDPAALRKAATQHGAQADKVHAAATAISDRAKALGKDWEAPEYTEFTNKATDLSATMIIGSEQELRQTADRLTSAAGALTDARTRVDAVITKFDGQAKTAIAIAKSLSPDQIRGMLNYARTIGVEACREAQQVTLELSTKLAGLFGQNSGSRLPEQEISRLFHVPMTAQNNAVWPESLWGIFGKEMTPAERDLIQQLPLSQRPTAVEAYREAEANARRFYPEPVPHEGSSPRTISPDAGHANAFKHAYWNARLAQTLGPQWTEAFTTAHETDLGNIPTHQSMDLFNNAVGRRIAAENPVASPSVLAERVREAVAQGRTVVIDLAGDIRYSDRIHPGQTGRLVVGTDH
jgi:hypothetical protein